VQRRWQRETVIKNKPKNFHILEFSSEEQMGNDEDRILTAEMSYVPNIIET